VRLTYVTTFQRSPGVSSDAYDGIFCVPIVTTWKMRPGGNTTTRSDEYAGGVGILPATTSGPSPLPFAPWQTRQYVWYRPRPSSIVAAETGSGLVSSCPARAASSSPGP